MRSWPTTAAEVDEGAQARREAVGIGEMDEVASPGHSSTCTRGTSRRRWSRSPGESSWPNTARHGTSILSAISSIHACSSSVGLVFRRLATDRPALYSIGVQRDVRDLPPWQPVCDAADAAFAALVQRVARLGDAGLLGESTVIEATLQFHALCQGLATLELRGVRIPFDAERIWRAALASLIVGFAAREPSGVGGV